MFNYFVFILRCWQDGSHSRFRLENPHTGESYLFHNLEDLNRFLEQTLLKDDEQHPPSNGDNAHDTQ